MSRLRIPSKNLIITLYNSWIESTRGNILAKFEVNVE